MWILNHAALLCGTQGWKEYFYTVGLFLKCLSNIILRLKMYLFPQNIPWISVL